MTKHDNAIYLISNLVHAMESSIKGQTPHGEKKRKTPVSILDASDEATILWILQQGRENGQTTKEIAKAIMQKEITALRSDRALKRLEKKGLASYAQTSLLSENRGGAWFVKEP